MRKKISLIFFVSITSYFIQAIDKDFLEEINEIEFRQQKTFTRTFFPDNPDASNLYDHREKCRGKTIQLNAILGKLKKQSEKLVNEQELLEHAKKKSLVYSLIELNINREQIINNIISSFKKSLASSVYLLRELNINKEKIIKSIINFSQKH